MADAVDDKYTLAWTEFQSTFSNSLELLRRENAFHDVTLVSDDEVHLNAHKVVLSAASSFFKRLLKRHPHQSPLLYLNGVQATDLQFILDYVYQGEVHLYQHQVNSFLVAAAKLKIAGLTNLATQQVGQEESNIVQGLVENPGQEETVGLKKDILKKRKVGRPRKERNQKVCSDEPEIVSRLENSLAENDPDKAETMRLIEEEILKSRTVMQKPMFEKKNVGRPIIKSTVPVLSEAEEGLGQRVMYYKEYENVEQEAEDENVQRYVEELEGF